MPRYFFHLKDGHDRLIDEVGRLIDDPAQIDTIALKEARALIAEEAKEGSINLNQRLEVFDEGGSMVRVMQFRDAVRLTPAPLKVDVRQPRVD